MSKKKDNEERKRIPLLRSCTKEISKPVDGIITGDIPSWVQGTLLRIGPGLMEIGSDKYVHAFDGLALLRNFSIRSGKITYMNHFLRSDTYNSNMKAKRIAVSEFGTNHSPDPKQSRLKRISSFFMAEDFSDNPFCFAKYQDDYYACNDTYYMWKIDPENLTAMRKIDLRKHAPLLTCTSHPRVDSKGSVYNIVSSTTKNKLNPRAAYVLVEFPKKIHPMQTDFELGGRIIGRIPATNPLFPSFYHSFAMTENYIIFVEHPMLLAIPRLLQRQAFSSITLENCVEWHPEIPARFHIMKKCDGSLIQTNYVADSFMVLHHINAYEEGSFIILDLCYFRNASVFKAFYVEALKEYAATDNPTLNSEYKASPMRFIIPLKIPRTEENLIDLPNTTTKAFIKKLEQEEVIHCYPEILSELEWFIELPRINENFNYKKYRYFYAVGRKDGSKDNCVVKVDVEKANVLVWTEEHAIPSEPVFVPRNKSGGDEDDGVLLVSLVFSDDEKKVALLALNAGNMHEMGRATFQVDSPVPADFHGIFIEKT